MKTKSSSNRSTLTLAAALAFFTHATLAQTWQTVDDFQYVPGQAAVNFGLTVAPSGILFASGFAFDVSGVSHGLVMASADAGNTWSAPLDDFVYPGSTTRYDGGIVSDSVGNLYVAGRYYFSSGPMHRFVRRSADGGSTWSVVDDVAFSGLSSFPLAANEITADAVGNVYVTGLPLGTWTIRKGMAGTSFSTVDTFQTSGSQACAVFAHSSAGIFAVGFGTIVNKRSSSQAWMVRRSLDGGATWTTVDAYQASSGYAATAFGAGADAQGNVYVVGRAATPSKGRNINHWQVRKSANGGASWSTVDDYELVPSGNQVALGFAAASNGNLYVAGWASASTTQGPDYWIVRKNPGGAGSWTTVDNFPYVASAEAHSIAADGLGNVFVGGQGGASDGVHWVVRKN